jgi:hypothetical protein
LRVLQYFLPPFRASGRTRRRPNQSRQTNSFFSVQPSPWNTTVTGMIICLT